MGFDSVGSTPPLLATALPPTPTAVEAVDVPLRSAGGRPAIAPESTGGRTTTAPEEATLALGRFVGWEGRSSTAERGGRIGRGDKERDVGRCREQNSGKNRMKATVWKTNGDGPDR